MDNSTSKNPLLIIIVPIIIISIAAIILNSILLLLLDRTRYLKTFSLNLIKVVAIIDLISGVNQCLCYFILNIVGGTEMFSSIWYCRLFGSITVYIPIISSILLSVLAVERYLILCRSSKLSPTKTKWCLIVVSILVLIPNIMVIVNNSYITDPTGTYCVPDNTTWSLVTKLILNITPVISCLVIPFCYISIVKSYPKSDGQRNTRVSIWFRALSLTSSYIICFAPLVVGLIWKYTSGDIPPATLFVLAPICFTAITVANPILVLALHRPLTKELMESLKWRTRPAPALELYSH